MKKEQPLNLYRLILASFAGLFFGRLNEKVKANFPRKIGDYNLVKQLKISKRNSKANKMFSYALYQNSKGQKAFGKVWSGKIKDFNYYTLKNEILLYEKLNRVIRRIGNSMPKKFQNIYIPQFLGNVETNNLLLLLTEFVEGIPASKLKTKKQFEIYLKTTDFLALLGNKLLAGEKKQIANRDTKTIIFLYFPFLLKSILTHPRAIISLFQGLPVFLRSIPELLKDEKLGLSHRDLHLDNIIISGKRTVLIDLQFCLFLNLLYDKISTLRLHWSDKEFRQRLLAEINNRYSDIEDFEIVSKGLMVNSATHVLISGNYSKKFIENYIGLLNFATKPNLQIGEIQK